MPAIDTRLYKELMQSLNKMEEGIIEAGKELPMVIDAEIVRSAKNRINSLKGAYEDSEERTKQFYHLYLQEIKNTRKEYARMKTIIYNHFGKKNKNVQKFGIRAYK